MIDKINKICQEEVTLYGYANLKSAKSYIAETYPSFVSKYPYAISIGINIPDEVIDTIDIIDEERKYLETYSKINEQLNRVGKKIEKILLENNYQAKLIVSSEITFKEELQGDISHKLIANLAGLGWIGKSCLLINPYYGPRIRWATILTNAPLPYSNTMIADKCRTCRLCVVNCPAGAFRGVKFDKNKPRKYQYDAYKCNNHFKELEKENRPRLCGLCVKVCPWGLVNKNKRKKKDIISVF